MQTYSVTGSTGFNIEQEAMELLEEMTNGRLDIELYGVGTLVKHSEQLEAIGAGAYEAGFNSTAYFTSLDPGFAPAFTLPGLWENPRHMGIWYQYFGGKELLRDAYAEYNVYLVTPTIHTGEPIHSKVALRTIDDFKGLKIRTLPGLTTDLFKLLGAEPIALPGSEVYSALDTGVVDAAEWVTIAENYDVGLHEVAPYILYPSFHTPAGVADFSFNMDVWNELSDADRAAVEAVGAWIALHYDYGPEAEGYGKLQKMLDYGVERTQLSDATMAEIKQMAVQVAEAYKTKSPLADAIITSQLDYLRLTGTID
jgi:TRAP-type mannitol/chloroaromatic compound transport system substrate-binding protein